METLIRTRFDPQITERDRQLPLWVTPRIHISDGHADAEGSTSAALALSLNPSAKAIRKLCDRGQSIFQIVEALRQQYIVDDVELYVDVTTAVLELHRLGLIGSSAAQSPDRPPTRFVMGVEDKTYFHWQLPILFESLIGQLPEGWDILVVVCNDHKPLSETLLRIFETYGVTYFTGTDHPRRQDMDFAGEGTDYVPLNRIEALRVVAPHVQNEDLVCLLDTDNFLYRELDSSIFPRGDALAANEIIAQNPFFTHAEGTAGVDLVKLLEAIGCQTPFGTGGVAVFLTGRTVKNEKFVNDCFRFTQVLYLLAKIAGRTSRTAWISEMPCFALSLTANGIAYEVIDSEAFMVDKPRSVPGGTFYHYYGDLKDSAVDGAFYDSEWHKQLFFHTDFLMTNLEEQFRTAVTQHELYFFELAKRARHRLDSTPAAKEHG